MRWFKHFSDAGDHPDHLRMRDRFGWAGYGLYWRILEMIAAHGTEFSLTLTGRIWARTLVVRQKLLRNFLELQKELGNFYVIYEGDEITVTVPNLRKYRDEWTSRCEKKNAKTREQLTSDSGVTPSPYRDIDIDTETDIEIFPPPDGGGNLVPNGEKPKTKKNNTRKKETTAELFDGEPLHLHPAVVIALKAEWRGNNTQRRIIAQRVGKHPLRLKDWEHVISEYMGSKNSNPTVAGWPCDILDRQCKYDVNGKGKVIC